MLGSLLRAFFHPIRGRRVAGKCSGWVRGRRLVHLGCPCGGGCLCKFMNGLDQQIWAASPSHPLLGVLSLLFRPNLQAAALS